MDRALYDLAEAACGHNSSMQWSLSSSILRRQVSPVFDRCADGSLVAEDALDIAMDFVRAGVDHNVEVVTELYQRLSDRATKQFPGHQFTALVQLQEFVMGLNLDAEWATNDVITRQEMYPLFVRLALGNTSTHEAMTTFCDHICSKRAYYLELMQQLTQRFTQEILEVSRSKEGAPDGDA